MSLVLTNATLIDCVDPNPVSEASVVIEDGRIAEITDGSHSPAGRNARVIDLGGAYLLPGLWDVHVHPAYATDPNITVAQQTAQFGQNLMRGLTEGGVVGARSGGAGHFMDVAWRDTFASGELDGPRLFACGNFLTTTGGHFLTSGHARECDGPYGFVNAVREQIKNGVDHIKLNLSGGIMGPSWDLHTHPFLLEDELTAAFAVCRQRGFDVMAHATNPDTVKTAIKLGAHSVEHGYIMDEECIQLFLEHDCWYVPTLGISHLTPSQASSEREKRWVEQKGRAPDLVARAEAAVDTSQKLVPEGAALWRQDGPGLGPLPAARVRPFGDGTLGQGRRHDVADAVGRHQERSGPVRHGGGPWNCGSRKDRRPDSRGRQSPGGHRELGQPSAGIEAGQGRLRPPPVTVIAERESGVHRAVRQRDWPSAQAKPPFAQHPNARGI